MRVLVPAVLAPTVSVPVPGGLVTVRLHIGLTLVLQVVVALLGA